MLKGKKQQQLEKIIKLKSAFLSRVLSILILFNDAFTY